MTISIDSITLTPLSEFARIMGINPLHFSGAVSVNSSPLEVMPLNNSCSNLWPQYAWQFGGRLSREDIGFELARAEEEIAQTIGYPIAPRWVVEESHQFPRSFPHWLYNTAGTGVRGMHKAIRTRYGRIVAGGQRGATVVEAAATVTYSDPDGDGFSELAAITATTTVTDENEIKVYFASKSAHPSWEIRPLTSVSISAGTVTITAPSWLFINPDLWEAFPTTDGFVGIEVSSTSNFVTTVDIYREYNDTTQPSAVFEWESPCVACSGSGCVACSTPTQNGCATRRDGRMLAPQPASYADGQWTSQAWTGGREPDRVKLYYYAGERSPEYLSGFTRLPVRRMFSKAASYMVVARSAHDLCECGNVSDLTSWLREDVTRLSEGPTFFTQPETSTNPFGTKRGEVLAWQMVSRLVDREMPVGVI